MAVSEWFSDEELIAELHMFFTAEEAKEIDFQACLGQLVDYDDETWQLTLKGKTFFVDKEFCNVRTDDEDASDDEVDSDE